MSNDDSGDEYRRLEGDEDDDDDFGRLQGRSGSIISVMSLNLSKFNQSPVMFFNEKFQAGSMKGSVATLVVSIVGAGTLSVPLALQEAGLVFGILLFVAGGFLAAFTLKLITISSELTATRSYEKVAKRLYGSRMSNLAVITLLTNLYGTIISYIVASGHTLSFVLSHFFPDVEIIKPQPITLIVLIGIILPLSLLRSMSALRYSSLFGVCCTFYLAIAVTLKYFEFCKTHTETGAFSNGYETDQLVTCFWEGVSNATDSHGEHVKTTGEELKLFNFDDLNQLFGAIPIVVYAYTCHPSLLPILLELNRPSLRRMTKVIDRANVMAAIIYILIGVFVYLTFADQVALSNGNFLLNDYKHDTTILLGAVGMAISVTFAVPLFVSSFRNIAAPFFTYIFDYKAYVKLISQQGPLISFKASQEDSDEDSSLDEAEEEPPQTHRINLKWHVFIAIFVLFLAGLPAVLVSDISYVFTVLGATTNPLLCFIFPAMFIVKAGGREYFYTKIFAVVIAVVVPLVSLYSLFLKVRSW